MDESEVKRLFLRTCPSFEASWREIEADWLSGGLSPINLLSELALHLVDEFAKKRAEELNACLRVVEDIFESGTKEVQAMVIMFFLAGLQNHAKGKGIRLEVFTPLLGGKTRAWWNDISQNWENWMTNRLACILEWFLNAFVRNMWLCALSRLTHDTSKQAASSR